jgi:hypothetical protein
VLALIDLAQEHDQSITIVYPPLRVRSPSPGRAALLHQFVHGNRESSVGIVSHATTMAART